MRRVNEDMWFIVIMATPHKDRPAGFVRCCLNFF